MSVHGIHLHPNELTPVGPIPQAIASALNCDKCGGASKVHKPIKAGTFAVDAVVTCPDCRGTGRYQYGRDERRASDS